MAKTTFPNTAAGLVSANAVADPKNILMRPNDIVVFTGTDMPETLDPTSVILNKQQFLYGVLTVGGQTLLNAVLAHQADQIANGTPLQKVHWQYANKFRRKDIYTRLARLAVKGAKTEAASLTEWNEIFIVGSGYEPPMSAG
jgi:hypothetical protein